MEAEKDLWERRGFVNVIRGQKSRSVGAFAFGGRAATNRSAGCKLFLSSCWEKKAFTIVELLVVIAIIGLLMAILLPAVQQTRETGRRINCTSNMKNQALGVLNFVDAHRYFPPGVYRAETLDHSWCSFILPYVEQEPLARQIDWSKPWDDPGKNKTVAETPLPLFRCPSSFLFTKRGGSDYGGILGSVSPKGEVENGVFIIHRDHPRTAYLTPAKVTDGLSYTIMIGESAGLDGVYEPMWAKGWNCFFSNGLIQQGEVGGFKSYHPGGAHAGFGDGTVRFLPHTTEQEIVWALCTRNGGEINKPWD